MDAELQQEINALIRELQGLAPAMRRGSSRALIPGAEHIRNAIARRTPVGDEPHSRYATAKISKKIRAPKGMGVVKAVYQPGNLKKSFQILPLRRAKFSKIVGPVVDKGGGGKTPDGYYAHMVEFDATNVDGSVRPGKYFITAAIEAAGGTAQRLIVEGLQGNLKKYTQRSKKLNLGQGYEAAKGR